MEAEAIESMEYNGVICYKKVVDGNEFWIPKSQKSEKFDAKKYYQNNKNMIKDKTRMYYEKNKDMIYVNGCKEYNCECGSTVIMRSKSHHLKSNKHLLFLETKTTI